MIDLSTHKFAANERGYNWLTFITVACLVAALVPVIFFIADGWHIEYSLEVLVSVVGLVLISIYAGFALYCDWRSLSYAQNTTLSIDMKTLTFTYTHAGKTVTFKGLDVEHWYWDTGLYISRVAANHSVIVLKTGETLFIHCWLFEDNHFFLSDYEQYNAGHFMSKHEADLLLPEAERASGYRYLLPPEN